MIPGESLQYFHRSPVGPVYVFRNISGLTGGMYNPNKPADDEDRAPFFKVGSNDPIVNGGRIYLYHNTSFQPPAPVSDKQFLYSFGIGGGIDKSGGATQNIIAKNNILTNFKNWWSSFRVSAGDTSSLYECNLYSGSTNVTLINSIKGEPIFSKNLDLKLKHVIYTTAGTGVKEALNFYLPTVDLLASEYSDFSLASNSLGYGKGCRINNFNDQYSAPDIGAHQSGTSFFRIGK